jgi:electron-transferring-flavoprotein dehydrogenase
MSHAADNPLQTDILCVGGGIASLSTTLALLRGLKARGGDKPLPRVIILEKSRAVGNHVLSGAVIDPAGFDGLLTADEIKRLPVEAHVGKESFHFLLDDRRSIGIPWVPPMMQAHGYPLGSLTKLTRYLATLCEQEGAEIYCGFSGAELLQDANGRVIGVKTGDKGVDRDGKPKSNFTPGEEIHARVVVLGEGACGRLVGRLIEKHGLQGQRPQSYALGLKEVIEVPADETRAGEIAHTFGYPSDLTTYGGGFVYHISATQVMVGYAYGLDYSRSEADMHRLFRQFKAHPAIASHLTGGKAVAYGAKVIPEGGLYAVPSLVADGAVIVGDSGGLLDSLRIKGIHMAMQSGRLAGEALATAWLNDDFSRKSLQAYEDALHRSEVWRQLQRVKNVRAPFSKHMALGVMSAGCAWLTGGSLPWWMVPMEPDHTALKPLRADVKPPPSIGIAPVSPDRLTDLFMSGTIHDEDQPCHLKILDREKCVECIKVYGAPCQRFCPAEVYRLEGDHIHIDFSNCLHCKTCEIKDPYRNIEWTLPQAGDGPRYTRM